MSDDLKSWHAESWHAGYHCRDHQVADLERMLRAAQSALTEQHAANARLQAERDALAEQLNSVTSMAERFGQERDALRALLPKLRLTHRMSDDPWYSCPKSEEGCANEFEGDDCTCGADKHNAMIDAALSTPPPAAP